MIKKENQSIIALLILLFNLNHPPEKQKRPGIYLYTLRISLFGVVNIFTDRANVLFHNVRIFKWFSE